MMEHEFGDVDIFLNCIITNGWRFTLFCFILLLEYFHCRTISLLGGLFPCVDPFVVGNILDFLKILVGPNLGVKHKNGIFQNFTYSLWAIF